MTTGFSAMWQASTNATMEDPGARHYRSNGPPTTQLAFSVTDDDNLDRHAALVGIVAGDRVLARSTATAQDWGDYRVTATPVDLVTWVRLDIEPVTAGTAPAPPGNNERILFDFVTPPAAGTGWTDVAAVTRALGPQAGGDPYIADCVAAANAWAPRKRYEAGYLGADGFPEDVTLAPSDDVAFGTTLYAVALYNERGATDSHASFQDLSGFVPATGSLGQINRLLGVGRAAVDLPPADPAAAPAARRWVTR